MEKLLECVPNFSEGRNKKVISRIVSSISSIPGVYFLDADSNYSANRTVITFIGNPDSVFKAMFNATKVAYELIDMSKHTGTHPRIGFVDVIPFIPYKNMTIAETVDYAHNFGEKLAKELNISGYYYEYAALSEEKRNLSNCRKGEYEGITEKIKEKKFQPDFGPHVFNKRAGLINIGVRNILIAYNVNLSSKDISIAKEIAKIIRESGYVQNKQRIKGLFKHVKAIGWYIKEFGKVQVSMNLTNFKVTNIDMVYEKIKELSNKFNVKVSGSELVGMVPLQALIKAGKKYLQLEKGRGEYNETDLINAAIKHLGLNDVKPFNPYEKIIEYKIKKVKSAFNSERSGNF